MRQCASVVRERRREWRVQLLIPKTPAVSGDVEWRELELSEERPTPAQSLPSNHGGENLKNPEYFRLGPTEHFGPSFLVGF